MFSQELALATVEEKRYGGHTSNGGDGLNIVWVRVVQQDKSHGSVGSGPGKVHRNTGRDASKGGIGQLEAAGRSSVHGTGGGSSHGETSELHFEVERGDRDETRSTCPNVR